MSSITYNTLELRISFTVGGTAHNPEVDDFFQYQILEDGLPITYVKNESSEYDEVNVLYTTPYSESWPTKISIQDTIDKQIDYTIKVLQQYYSTLGTFVSPLENRISYSKEANGILVRFSSSKEITVSTSSDNISITYATNGIQKEIQPILARSPYIYKLPNGDRYLTNEFIIYQDDYSGSLENGIKFSDFLAYFSDKTGVISLTILDGSNNPRFRLGVERTFPTLSTLNDLQIVLGSIATMSDSPTNIVTTRILNDTTKVAIIQWKSNINQFPSAFYSSDTGYKMTLGWILSEDRIISVPTVPSAQFSAFMADLNLYTPDINFNANDSQGNSLGNIINIEYATYPYALTSITDFADSIKSYINSLDGYICNTEITDRLYFYITVTDLGTLIESIDFQAYTYAYDGPLFGITTVIISPYLLFNANFDKVEYKLFIYRGNIFSNKPETPTYIKQKQKALSTQDNIWINPSNIIRDNIEGKVLTYLSRNENSNIISNPLDIQESAWCYSDSNMINTIYDGESITEIFVKQFIVLDGYIEPSDTYTTDFDNYNALPNILLPYNRTLLSQEIKRQFQKDSFARIHFVTKDLISAQYVYGSTAVTIDVITDPVQSNEYVSSILVDTSTVRNITFIFTYETIGDKTVECEIVDEECKYKQYDVIYKNRYGVLETMTFNKKASKSLNTETNSYLRSIVDIDGNVNTTRHTNKNFNTLGYEEWTLNTGFLPEYTNLQFQDLKLSEEIWIYDSSLYYPYYGEGVIPYVFPVNNSETTFSYKTQLNEKLIQYTMKFKLSHSTLNNIQ